MGFSPVEVDRMTYWQLFATSEGWVEAKTEGMKTGLNDQEAGEMFEWLQTRPSVPLSHKRNANGKVWGNGRHD